jgi:hypothetical protein
MKTQRFGKYISSLLKMREGKYLLCWNSQKELTTVTGLGLLALSKGPNRIDVPLTSLENINRYIFNTLFFLAI